MPDFKQYYLLNATPHDVYLALTHKPTIMLWTGDKAEMKAEPDTEFSLWDGSIVGRNIEFTEGKKIVQHWYFGEQNEPSIVTIKLHEHNKGTSAELVHTNIPEDDFDEIVDGWNNYYFGALQDFYEEE